MALVLKQLNPIHKMGAIKFFYNFTLFCFFLTYCFLNPPLYCGLLLRGPAQWSSVNHGCFFVIEEVINLNGAPWGILTENIPILIYIMHKLTDLFCLTILFAKFNILASFNLHFPMEQGHSVPSHKVWREAFHGTWRTNCFVGQFIGGMLYMEG